MNALGSQIANLWGQLLDLLSKIVNPDWGALVNLLPVFLVGPVILGLLALAGGWVVYTVRRPRARVRVAEGPRPALLDEAGAALFPDGEPFCPRDALVYPPGAARCDACHEELAVRCPMCGLERPSSIVTCGNCGLVLRVEPRVRLLQPTGPPPGGAAAA